MNRILVMFLVLGLGLSPVFSAAAVSHAHDETHGGVHDDHGMRLGAPVSDPGVTADRCARDGEAHADLHCCSVVSGHCGQIASKAEGGWVHHDPMAIALKFSDAERVRPGPALEISPPPPRS